MEFEGTLYRILPVTKGTSARGDWQRQDVIFDYSDGGNFTRKMCVTFFNRPDDVAKLREGSRYQVSVNIDAREYNGRWYNDIRAWRVQRGVVPAPGVAAPVTPAGVPAPTAPVAAPAPAAPAAAAPAAAPAPADNGDLPF